MTLPTHSIHATVEKIDSGFAVYATDYPVSSTGNTMTELQKNIIDALNNYFKENEMYSGAKDIKLNIDLKQFFQHYRVINAKHLAERIGMNPVLLSQYVQGRKRPSTTQVEKIVRGIHTIGRELSEITLV